ncbi:MAG: hypothetical protein JST21_03790 [Bacteroidetes bacterium]|nr:hypothetical protein [Bacteroidota bacterium]
MEDFNHLEGDEKLKAENAFLKMKLMLENGCEFAGTENNELPAEIENEFLNNIVDFEKQFAEKKSKKVFDVIGRPAHFKPVAEIPDEDIDTAWKELRKHLNDHGIDMDACSPNISVRELYRFTTEELFEHETGGMAIPGWSMNYIYDEFHPDPIYENSRLVGQDLFHDIFSKRDLFYEIHYCKGGFDFNDCQYADYNVYAEMINNFKSLFDKIKIKKFKVEDCSVQDNDCWVKGHYKAIAVNAKKNFLFPVYLMCILSKRNMIIGI